MSEQPEMKYSNIEHGNNTSSSNLAAGKDKLKKSPYQNELDRPESSKEFHMNRSSITESTENDSSLSSSYGNTMKKSRIDKNDNISSHPKLNMHGNINNGSGNNGSGNNGSGNNGSGSGNNSNNNGSGNNGNNNGKQEEQKHSSSSSDPASEWVKKSWNKKKDKKISIDDFEQIKELGSGKYGQVFLAREKKSNFVCAVKIIEKKLLQEEEITEQFTR